MKNNEFSRWPSDKTLEERAAQIALGELMDCVEGLNLPSRAKETLLFDDIICGDDSDNKVRCLVDRQANSSITSRSFARSGHIRVYYSRATEIPSYARDLSNVFDVKTKMDESVDGRPPAWDVYRIGHSRTLATLWRRGDQFEAYALTLVGDGDSRPATPGEIAALKG